MFLKYVQDRTHKNKITHDGHSRARTTLPTRRGQRARRRRTRRRRRLRVEVHVGEHVAARGHGERVVRVELQQQLALVQHLQRLHARAVVLGQRAPHRLHVPAARLLPAQRAHALGLRRRLAAVALARQRAAARAQVAQHHLAELVAQVALLVHQQRAAREGARQVLEQRARRLGPQVHEHALGQQQRRQLARGAGGRQLALHFAEAAQVAAEQVVPVGVQVALTNYYLAVC